MWEDTCVMIPAFYYANKIAKVDDAVCHYFINDQSYICVSLPSSFRNLSISTNREQIAESACEIKVAHAAPAIPICLIIKISRPIFSRDEQIKNMSGICEAPSALKIALVIL